MKPLQLHYRILKIVSWFGKVSLHKISYLLATSEDVIGKCLEQMINSDLGGHGPWVYKMDGLYSVAGVRSKIGSEVQENTGGWAALISAIEQPYFESDDRAFVDEATTGMTKDGQESSIKWAAVPTRPHTKYSMPEKSAFRANRRFEAHEDDDGLKRQGLRYCPTCRSEVIEKNQKRCKPCDRRRKRKK